VHVVAADAHPRSPGFFSRYAAERVVYPPPRIDGPATVAALARSARERRIDLVIPVAEEPVLLLSGARDRFGDGTVLALPETDAFEIARDKFATVELATRLGVPTPRTLLVRTAAEALREAAGLGQRAGEPAVGPAQ
jgi:biotin carboxylase